ncbi:MAG TPA: patatin-like phospholipase family protein [Burkholderiaceae bacterium]|nr:patatin-like phospholipase family protein [Burkholderiaceae bacterium]
MRRLLLTFLLAFATAAQAEPVRPRVGLVLSGGGARGIAHVGVLKVLEKERIPIDAIAGTSMGAIVGGLYASGMSATEIEREILAVDWDGVFSNRVERQHLSQRRKEEDFEISAALELGVRAGELRAPVGAVSGRGLDTLLRRYTLPVRAVQDFDRLAIPFRAVATDLETGAPVILHSGDLAQALRSSMSVPGVFPPIEVDGRLLGDGGLVSNVPIDVARAMGVDVVIVVNVGTPLAGRATLQSVVGITAQMINILTEQNVQRSLATLAPRDVLVAPSLGSLSAADFGKAADAIALGERGALAVAERLRTLAVAPEVYAQWRSEHPRARRPEARIDFVAFEGSHVTHPERFAAQLESRPGQDFDRARAERDARTLAASGDYLRTDYRLVTRDGRDGLVFELEDKPWGPNYLRFGVDLSTDFQGRGTFNLKLSHNRHWLTDNGTEWRNRIQIGVVPAVFTELYHPLKWTLGVSGDWFVAAYAGAERKIGTLYDPVDGTELARYRRTFARAGVDLGQPWGRFGELRLGLFAQRLRASPTLVAVPAEDVDGAVILRQSGARLGAVVDQLDYANFPTRGARIVGSLELGEDSDEGRYRGLDVSALAVTTVGAHSLSVYGLARGASSQKPGAIGRYELGGFHQLSGYRDGQLLGNYVLFTRLGWYMRLPYTPVVGRAFFLGATAEAGNAWTSKQSFRAGEMRTGMSLYIGADTGVGPLYLALTHAPRGSTGVMLFLGRP